MSRCEAVDLKTGERCSFEAEKGSCTCPGLAKQACEESRLFEVWMQEVVIVMEAGYGFHPQDLTDCPYADWHAGGLDPEEAVQQAISLCAGDDLFS